MLYPVRCKAVPYCFVTTELSQLRQCSSACTPTKRDKSTKKLLVCSLRVSRSLMCILLRAQEAAAEARAVEAMDGSSPAEDSEAADINDAWWCPICLGWFDMPVAPPCQHSFCAGVGRACFVLVLHLLRTSIDFVYTCRYSHSSCFEYFIQAFNLLLI